MRLYARLHDLDLVDVVVDAAESAKTLGRGGLQAVLARLKGGEADGLLVAKLDRLTRSVRDLGELIEAYFGDRRGYALLSVAEQIDTRSAAGRLARPVGPRPLKIERYIAVVGAADGDASGDIGRQTLLQANADGSLDRVIVAGQTGRQFAGGAFAPGYFGLVKLDRLGHKSDGFFTALSVWLQGPVALGQDRTDRASIRRRLAECASSRFQRGLYLVDRGVLGDRCKPLNFA